MRQPTHPMLRQAFAVVATVTLGCHCPDAASSDAGLIACWKGESIIQFFADGTPRASAPGACILQFTANRIHAICNGPQGSSEVKYSYQVVRPGVYSARMIAHEHRPDLIGSEREYEYRLEGDRLFLTTYPQTTKPAPPTTAVRVESRSVKVACP